MPLEFPLDNQSKGTIENTNFTVLKALKFKGGLPVFTTIPTYTGTDGEMVLYTSGSTYAIYTYINSEWRNMSLTETAHDHSEYIQDIVEDTTPQLGGALDTNDKAITSEGGRIQRHTIYKTLADNVATNLFTLSGITLGAFGAIFMRFSNGFADADGIEITYGMTCCNFGRYGGGVTASIVEDLEAVNDRTIDNGAGYSIGCSFSSTTTESSLIMKATSNTGSGDSSTISIIVEIISNTDLTYTEA